MARLSVLAVAALLLAPQVLAETVKGIDQVVVPPDPSDGTAEMKWEKLDRIPFPCIAGEQICTCFLGSDVVDCRHPIPIAKPAN